MKSKINELHKQMDILKKKTSEFKFTINRPWVVLGAGDVVNG
jgi:hypothetical protein